MSIVRTRSCDVPPLMLQLFGTTGASYRMHMGGVTLPVPRAVGTRGFATQLRSQAAGADAVVFTAWNIDHMCMCHIVMDAVPLSTMAMAWAAVLAIMCMVPDHDQGEQEP
eukprot:jgi/Ulvmu1/6108/UM027_0086.1